MVIYMHGLWLFVGEKNVGILCSTWNVEMGICALEWVCRSFSLVILIGKSNTPLLQMNSCIVDFKKFHFVFWCQGSPADRLVVDLRVVFCYVVA